MMVLAKIHFEYLKGIAGSILEDHLSKTSKLTAVKVSAAYTATATMARNHSQMYDSGVQKLLLLKSESACKHSQ